MNWIESRYFKRVALVLAFAVFSIAAVPAQSLAYMVGTDTVINGADVSISSDRATDIERVQRTLESKIVADKLTELGLSADEVTERLEGLTDADLHHFATQIDTLNPGGGIVSGLGAILVVVLLVLILLKVTDRKIIIK